MSVQRLPTGWRPKPCRHDYIDGSKPEAPCYTCADCGSSEHVLSLEVELDGHCMKCGVEMTTDTCAHCPSPDVIGLTGHCAACFKSCRIQGCCDC